MKSLLPEGLTREIPQTEAFLSKAISSKDLKRTSPPEIVPTTLFGKMKSLLSSTIGESKLARNFYGVYRKQSLQMLKFSIHEDKGELFELWPCKPSYFDSNNETEKK